MGRDGWGKSGVVDPDGDIAAHHLFGLLFAQGSSGGRNQRGHRMNGFIFGKGPFLRGSQPNGDLSLRHAYSALSASS